MIDIIFNYINLFILILLGVYYFKKYILPNIKQSINERLLFISNLSFNINNLKKEQKRIEQETVDQKIICKELLFKVDQWKEKFQSNEMEEKVKWALIQKDLQEKLKVQSNNHALILAKKQITPRLINILENDLIAFYQDEKHAREYISQTLDDIKK